MPATSFRRCARAARVAAAMLLATGAAAQDAGGPRVSVETLADDVLVLTGTGGEQPAGNVLAVLGQQGTLLVDTGFSVYVPQYAEAIAAAGGGNVVYAIDTHWHDDHAEGNKAIGAAGSALLVAHDRSRARLMRHNRINVVRTVLDQPAYPASALPVLTFDGGMTLFFDGERVDLLHAAPAHTDGDVAVIFRGRNIVHMGDVFVSSAYPFFDVDNGGDFDGLIEFIRRVLATIDRDTIVVPGHGAVARYEDLERYLAMLTAVRTRIAELIAAGATLEQVIAAGPTADWDARYGNPTSYFIDRAYASLAGQPP